MPLTRQAPNKLKTLLRSRHRQTPATTFQRIERRSATRPTIIESWRKTLRDWPPPTSSSSKMQNARVDVWVAHTESFLRAESCLAILTEEDRACLARLKAPSSRISATAARVLLRLGLSRAADRSVAPSEWQFKTTKQGKPVVAQHLPDIKFSVSHVDQLAMVAVSSSLEVGIDVENIDQSLSPDLVDNFCHSDEQSSLRSLPTPQRTREFIRLWTLKEAYTKMVGTGHSVDFTWIKFMLDPVNLEATSDFPTKSKTLFETFFVTARHSFYHASIAIDYPPRSLGSTELQIISLADPTGLDGAVPMPISD
jgi:4'-phosphopantetheinyl transferase